MGIRIRDGLFSLETKNTLYQMKADDTGFLRHLYYGRKTEQDMSYLVRQTDRAFSGNPYDKKDDRSYSLDTLPQEYPVLGTGDYRSPALITELENGSRTCELRFAEVRQLKGKKKPEGLPGVRGNTETEGLEIILKDKASGLSVHLIYYVFEEQDVITRSTLIVNEGKAAVTLVKAASMSIDYPCGGPQEAIHFHGRHCMERIPERLPIPNGGILSAGSVRGTSSHHSNPFVILCNRSTTENSGESWGFMLMYSGNHLEETGMDQTGSIRLVAGIHPETFRWKLGTGESFQTPEAILSYSGEGLNGLSRNYHRIIRNEVIRPQRRNAEAPVLLNSWEASYFDFDANSLMALAREAKTLGMDMLVLDDGWFGKRNDDTSGLGDWTANEKKLGCTLEELSGEVHREGLKFGLWVEPEMISEDSDLYRSHPDWALTDPDRKPVVGRSQLVLDLSRRETQDYLFDALSAILDKARIEYIKWDFNRSIASFYSHALSADRQGETAHRFVLGVYRLLERLLDRYPDLLIEGCSGGGGRFDAGMLYYTPQIWCSDDTDAIERLEIQRGTSYGYPLCTVGSHVSACPNHQTGRTVPMKTRGIVAQSGTFGYELNPALLSDEERTEIREQIKSFRKLRPLLAEGDYYRLDEIGSPDDYTAWMVVSPDRREAVVNLVVTHVRANAPFPYLRLCGLDPECIYTSEETGEELSGAALMHGGYTCPLMTGDYPAICMHWISKEKA
jgi:alpha-galactosidase